MEKKTIYFILILFLLLILRLFSFYLQKPSYKEGEFLSFTTNLFSQPKTYPGYQGFSVETPKGDLIYVKAKPDKEYNYGDKLNISGTLGIQMLKTNSLLIMKFPKIEAVKNNNPYFLAVVISVRQKITSFFRETLPGDSSALMLGIVFGIRDDLSKNFLLNLKTTGVMHVIAASGMNVTMVGGLIFYLFALFLKRQTAIIFSVFAILFYALLAGFEASIIRASIMAIIAFSSQVFGKQNYSIYALFLTAFIMLFAFPKFLADIGFQLSFLSTLGIIYIPTLFKKFENAFYQDFLTTVSAQIATLPILLANFGTYSLWSIVVNTLILWTVPILMILGGIASLLSFFFEPLGKLFLLLCIPLLTYFEDIVNFFGKPSLVISLNSFPWQFIFSYYLFIGSLTLFLKRRKG